MTTFLCFGCQQHANLEAVGQYLCRDCRTDDHTKTARSNLQAGGFTITPLTGPSGATKDTSPEIEAHA